jgi:hypothetical protein
MTCARLLPAVAEVHLVATAADNLTPVELLNNDCRSICQPSSLRPWAAR